MPNDADDPGFQEERKTLFGRRRPSNQSEPRPSAADYYDLFDVSPDATRDEIRAAYRARRDELAGNDTDETREEAADLNRAWNVLSDTTQRARYDERLAAEREDFDDDEDDEDDDWVDEDGDESADERPKRMSMREAREQLRRDRAEQGAALPLEVAGMQLAPPRRRMFSLVVDLLLVAALVVAGIVIGSAMSRNKYPDEFRQAAALSREHDRIVTLREIAVANGELQDAEQANDADAANDAEAEIADLEQDRQEQLDDLQTRLAEAEADGDQEDIAELNAEIEQAEGEAAEYASTENPAAAQEKAEERIDELNDQIADVQSKTAGPATTAFLVAFLVALAINVIPSALWGKSLGKFLFKLRLVRETGVRAGFQASIVHYGLPLVFVALTMSVLPLGPIGPVVAIFGVTTFARNPKQQGWHDRVAHTYVVAD